MNLYRSMIASNKPFSPSRQPSDRQQGKTTLLFIGIALLSIAIGVFVQTGVNKPKELPEFKKTIILPKAKNISNINFTDHLGQPFAAEHLKEKWSILFFGFTNCPDICPTTMQTLKQVKQTVSEQSLWGNYQVIMVSVDPERDSIERLANYVPFFDPEFIGISSDVETTTQFAKQMGILFVKRESQSNALYEVDHSASIILINPQGQWAGVITAPHKADEISSDLIKLAKHVGNVEKTSAVKTPSPQDTSKIIETNQSGLVIKQAWIRPAPPNVQSMAGYFEISNTTNEDISIVDSSSTGFNMTMVHDTVIESGVARMRHLNSFNIPANSSLTLKPLGTHMMLMGPLEPLKIGDVVGITLIDDNDKKYEYSIEVRPQPN